MVFWKIRCGSEKVGIDVRAVISVSEYVKKGGIIFLLSTRKMIPCQEMC